MLIDFHVHIFPDKIAERTLAMLQNNMRSVLGVNQELSFGGTLSALKAAMEEKGVDLSVIMPIATKVTQYKTINDYAEEITDGKTIISFASLHPYQDDVNDRLLDIVSRGFKGIKLHPDYQGVFADDEKFISLVKRATELGLYVTIHAGEDGGIRSPYRGTVEHLIPMLKKVDSSRIILAHMGAFREWDAVESEILKYPVYIDTSVVSKFINIEQYRRIIDKRGADRVLFGSDSPWEDSRDTLAFLKASGISDEEFELITHKNAEKILF